MFWDCAQNLVCKVKGTDRRSCVGILPKTNLKTSQDGYKTKMGSMPKTILKSSRESFGIVPESSFELFSGSVPNDHLGLCPNKISGTSTRDVLGSCPKARLIQYKMYSLSKAETVAI